MVVRIFQLINNYYKDKEETRNDSEMQSPLGEYMCFGYFDALKATRFKEVADGREDIWQMLEAVTLEEMNGKSNCKNLVCCMEDSSKDASFWEKAKETPFLFMTMVRINTKNDESKKELEDLKKDYNTNRNDVIVMESTGHCEAVILYTTDKYSKGFKFIQELRNRIKPINLYTISSVRESMLVDADTISEHVIEENIICRLRAAVKQEQGVGKFLNELAGRLGIKTKDILYCDNFGNCDIVIEMNNISIRKFLALYKDSEILTHSNTEFYGSTFFNIETEILYKKELN